MKMKGDVFINLSTRQINEFLNYPGSKLLATSPSGSSNDES